MDVYYVHSAVADSAVTQSIVAQYVDAQSVVAQSVVAHNVVIQSVVAHDVVAQNVVAHILWHNKLLSIKALFNLNLKAGYKVYYTLESHPEFPPPD